MRIGILGAGFAGLGAALRLKAAGFGELTVYERAAELGGTWRDNTYPGCACDIPSQLYSFSFAPNPEWTRMYPSQPEIWDYLRRMKKTVWASGCRSWYLSADGRNDTLWPGSTLEYWWRTLRFDVASYRLA